MDLDILKHNRLSIDEKEIFYIFENLIEDRKNGQIIYRHLDVVVISLDIQTQQCIIYIDKYPDYNELIYNLAYKLLSKFIFTRI